MLIIVADDLGFADVGFNGATFATPSIDRIARTGMVLDRFYNSPLCSPSRAGMLTGRYLHRYGIMGDTLLGAAGFFDPRRQYGAHAWFAYRTSCVDTADENSGMRPSPSVG